MTRAEARETARRIAYNYEQAAGGDPCLCWVVARAGVKPSDEAAVRCGDCEHACGAGGTVLGAAAPHAVYAAVADFIAALRGGAFDD